MNEALALELFGYLGSVLILVSMLMTSVVRLRVINLIGSAIFAAYALLIRSYPTALLNACLVGINVYHLIRLKHPVRSGYEVQKLGCGDGITEWITGKYAEDIRHYFPDADAESIARAEGFAVLMDNSVAGVLLGTPRGESFYVLLDYSIPAYRDCSVARALFDKLPEFGITELVCDSCIPEHVSYMEKMGFKQREDGSYAKALGNNGDRA